jgi:hypothetical protein
MESSYGSDFQSPKPTISKHALTVEQSAEKNKEKRAKHKEAIDAARLAGWRDMDFKKECFIMPPCPFLTLFLNWIPVHHLLKV